MMKLFKRDEYKNHGRFLGWGSGPDADWKIIFSAFIILLLASVIYSASTFLRVNGGNFGSETSITSESPIDSGLLRRNSQYYKNQKAEFESLRTVKETTPDPSI